MLLVEHNLLNTLDFDSILEPTYTHQFGQSFSSIDTEISEESWNNLFDGTPPQSGDSDSEPYNWFTIAWQELARAHLTAYWDGYTFRDLCYYDDPDDFSILTLDPFDLY